MGGCSSGTKSGVHSHPATNPLASMPPCCHCRGHVPGHIVNGPPPHTSLPDQRSKEPAPYYFGSCVSGHFGKTGHSLTAQSQYCKAVASLDARPLKSFGGWPHLVGGINSSPRTQQLLHHLRMLPLSREVQGGLAILHRHPQEGGGSERACPRSNVQGGHAILHHPPPVRADMSRKQYHHRSISSRPPTAPPQHQQQATNSTTAC
jgi:hypothetical protein